MIVRYALPVAAVLALASAPAFAATGHAKPDASPAAASSASAKASKTTTTVKDAGHKKKHEKKS